MKSQKYAEQRPKEYFDRFHERVRAGRPGPIYRIVRVVLTLPLLAGFRFRAIGLENVPTRGALILTPNHFSNFDHFLAATLLPREVQFMAKSQLFTNPIITYIISHGGAFPVRRGHHDEEPFVTAHTVLDRGGMLLVYAEGGRSRSKQLGTAKPGVGRLALETGVPVVPVAIEGSQHVRDTKRRLRVPRVTIQFGEPLTFEEIEHPTGQESQEAADVIFDRVRTMYESLAKDGRKAVIDARRADGGQAVPDRTSGFPYA